MHAYVSICTVSVCKYKVRALETKIVIVKQQEVVERKTAVEQDCWTSGSNRFLTVENKTKCCVFYGWFIKYFTPTSLFMHTLTTLKSNVPT